MEQEILAQYRKLVDFLAESLGPPYEIVLYDLTGEEGRIAAIRNEKNSGRQLGDPIESLPLKYLCEDFSGEEMKLHCRELTQRGKSLRANTMPIRLDGKLIGMLSVNFDDSVFQAVCGTIMRICHPTSFVEPMMVPVIRKEERADQKETQNSNTNCTTGDIIARELTRRGVTADRLSPQERYEVIEALKAQGVFQWKGAVQDVADALQCSRASIYRYLSKAK